nr:uncharacterized protein LOC117992178 [Maniola hyperantus]
MGNALISEEGTHDYTTGCGYVTPEATCDNPNPVTDTSGKVCDYTACYCDSPTVRDTATDKCVRLEDCPKKEEEKKDAEKKEEEKEDIVEKKCCNIMLTMWVCYKTIYNKVSVPIKCSFDSQHGDSGERN